MGLAFDGTLTNILAPFGNGLAPGKLRAIQVLWTVTMFSNWSSTAEVALGTHHVD